MHCLPGYGRHRPPAAAVPNRCASPATHSRAPRAAAGADRTEPVLKDHASSSAVIGTATRRRQASPIPSRRGGLHAVSTDQAGRSTTKPPMPRVRPRLRWGEPSCGSPGQCGSVSGRQAHRGAPGSRPGAAVDRTLGYATQAYDLASLRLRRVNGDIHENSAESPIASRNLHRAQRTVSARLVDLYLSGGENSTLEVLVGATSLDEVLSRIDASDRIAQADSGARSADDLPQGGSTAASPLAGSEEEGVRAGRRARGRAGIDQARLSERRRLLASVRDEVTRLEAQGERAAGRTPTSAPGAARGPAAAGARSSAARSFGDRVAKHSAGHFRLRAATW